MRWPSNRIVGQRALTKGGMRPSLAPTSEGGMASVPESRRPFLEFSRMHDHRSPHRIVEGRFRRPIIRPESRN